MTVPKYLIVFAPLQELQEPLVNVASFIPHDPKLPLSLIAATIFSLFSVVLSFCLSLNYNFHKLVITYSTTFSYYLFGNIRISENDYLFITSPSFRTEITFIRFFTVQKAFYSFSLRVCYKPTYKVS